MVTTAQIKSGLMGFCVGDALGVPVEFSTREQRNNDPVMSMRGYGTYNQPPGTWSDDSSLTFCLAEAIAEVGLGDELPEHLGRKMGLWLEQGYWTAHGDVFDVGNTTAIAIRKMLSGESPLMAGGSDEHSNGNGSLMRILPLAFVAEALPYEALLDLAHNISSLTHRHPRSLVACGIYLSVAMELLDNRGIETAYERGIRKAQDFYENSIYHHELEHYEDVLLGNLAQLSIDEIQSSGYVVHSLEAALWCCLRHNNYADTVLAAVNLGEDTDTIAAIAGGLAGIYYGLDDIPEAWQQQVCKKNEILALGDRLICNVDGN